MYLGRIVAVGRTVDGKNAALYRVSSRSFPNRRAVFNDKGIAIVPRVGAEGDLAKNPYISYNALRIAGKVWGVATNGSQTDPIAEKIDSGMPVRDAISLGLLALDYEHDSLDTPRIVAVVHCCEPVGFLGIIRKDALLVRQIELVPGKVNYLSTYTCDRPSDAQCGEGFAVATADEAAKFAVSGGVFADFDHPVTSAAALAENGGFSLGSFICE